MVETKQQKGNKIQLPLKKQQNATFPADSELEARKNKISRAESPTKGVTNVSDNGERSSEKARTDSAGFT
jgi:hypothetical protein